MRLIGAIKDEQQAQRFAAYLVTLGVSNSIDFESSAWQVWVCDEDSVEKATGELRSFNENPNAPLYQAAEAKAAKLRRGELEKARQAKKNQVSVRDNWSRSSPFATRQKRPLTISFVLLCVLIAFATGFGGSAESTGGRPSRQSGATPLGDQLFWLSHKHAGKLIQTRNTAGFLPDPAVVMKNAPAAMTDIRNGELWRMVTPIFIHLSIYHLLFNMLSLLFFGSQIEHRISTWRFGVLVLVIALFSNFLEALCQGPFFGGFSGVIYGLFGYVWMRSIYAPQEGYLLSPSAILIMVGWLFVCMWGVLDTPIANWAHGGGLAIGMVIGCLPLWLAKLRRTTTKK
jgi:GlpG protein